MTKNEDQLYAVACTGTPVSFRAFVVNDQDTRSSGSHWISLAYSAELRDGEAPGAEAEDDDEEIHAEIAWDATQMHGY